MIQFTSVEEPQRGGSQEQRGKTANKQREPKKAGKALHLTPCEKLVKTAESMPRKWLRKGKKRRRVSSFLYVEVHWYPRGNVSAAVRLSDMQQVFAECGSGSSGGKPCWLTEWGLPAGNGKSCPVADDGRAAVFSELRNDFSQVVRQGRLKGIIFYTWEGNIHDPNYRP
jgi:hypothetical protein